eukprot:1322394-Amorphochlora_amoeboformis.AAC.1
MFSGAHGGGGESRCPIENSRWRLLISRDSRPPVSPPFCAVCACVAPRMPLKAGAGTDFAVWVDADFIDGFLLTDSSVSENSLRTLESPSGLCVLQPFVPQ